MPTPFSHLWIAHRLLNDLALPEAARVLLHDARPAFLLGSVIADARPGPSADRETTHFYRYDTPMTDHPWRVMITRYPTLMQPEDRTHYSFVASYVAHLATDEFWSKQVLQPHFYYGEWGESRRWRFFVLHLLLIAMDERDAARIPESYPPTMRRAQPDDWLPFMSDGVICDWRDFIADQLEGESQTVPIIAERIATEAAELRRILDTPQQMQDMLWQHITPTLLDDLEAQMYDFTRAQLLTYLNL